LLTVVEEATVAIAVMADLHSSAEVIDVGQIPAIRVRVSVSVRVRVRVL